VLYLEHSFIWGLKLDTGIENARKVLKYGAGEGWKLGGLIVCEIKYYVESTRGIFYIQ
jgi:hypothetical protein